MSSRPSPRGRPDQRKRRREYPLLMLEQVEDRVLLATSLVSINAAGTAAGNDVSFDAPGSRPTAGTWPSKATPAT